MEMQSRRDSCACFPRSPHRLADREKMHGSRPSGSSNKWRGIRAARREPESPGRTATSGAADQSAENKTERGKVPRHKTFLRKPGGWRRCRSLRVEGEPEEFQPTTRHAAAFYRN